VDAENLDRNISGRAPPESCQPQGPPRRYGSHRFALWVQKVTLKASPSAQFRDQFKSPCLVEIIELKWLLAGHGVRVHVEQIQTDREYARRTLSCAEAASNPALREAAARLRDCMCLHEA
jgi:hypothetical protein